MGLGFFIICISLTLARFLTVPVQALSLIHISPVEMGFGNAKKILKQMNRLDVPVYIGESTPLRMMDHVWDNSVDSFSNSIRVHISALRKKLRAALGHDPIRNRIGEGYLMGGEEA